MVVLAALLLSGCSEELRVHYGDRFLVEDPFYGVGTCTVVGYHRTTASPLSERVRVHARCAYGMGAEESKAFDQGLVLERKL
jgi:hypothetical protein